MLIMPTIVKKLTYFYNEKSLDAYVKFLDNFTTEICRVRSLKLV